MNRCRLCEAPARVRYALARIDEPSATALAMRAEYRCASCWRGGEPDWLVALQPGRTLVVDPRFTRLLSGELCACGLPAGHLSGGSPNAEAGRPCRRPPRRRP